jgi:hypothetical protein
VIPRLLLAACASLFASHAAALLTRPDRDDAEYLELASRYTSSVPLNAPGGEAVLIAPRWLLTSAERARNIARIRIGTRDFAVQSTHTEARSGIALLLLREPVGDVEPTPIYRGRDEAGKGVVIAAHGGDGRKRALTPAETGAGAYLQVDGDLFIAGIATAVVGERETYARISSVADWIDETMFRAGADEAKAIAPKPGR